MYEFEHNFELYINLDEKHAFKEQLIHAYDTSESLHYENNCRTIFANSLFVHYSIEHGTHIQAILIFLRNKTIHFTVSKYKIIHLSRESKKRSARLLSLDESSIFVREVIHIIRFIS